MKKEIVITSISCDFQIQVNYSATPLQLSEKTHFKIEEIWKQELIRTRGKVFNGEILSAAEVSPNQIKGHFVEYKHYLAQTRDPSLFNELQIQPVCVCGCTFAGNKILIGKRSDYVTAYANCFELVPAGGIDPSSVENDYANIVKQVEIELKEEAGLTAEMIEKITPKFLLFCPQTHIYEVCSYIEVDPSSKQSTADRDDEYTELFWIDKSEIKKFIEFNQGQMIPLSLQILNLFI